MWLNFEPSFCLLSLKPSWQRAPKSSACRREPFTHPLQIKIIVFLRCEVLRRRTARSQCLVPVFLFIDIRWQCCALISDRVSSGLPFVVGESMYFDRFYGTRVPTNHNKWSSKFKPCRCSQFSSSSVEELLLLSMLILSLRPNAWCSSRKTINSRQLWRLRVAPLAGRTLDGCLGLVRGMFRLWR